MGDGDGSDVGDGVDTGGANVGDTVGSSYETGGEAKKRWRIKKPYSDARAIRLSKPLPVPRWQAEGQRNATKLFTVGFALGPPVGTLVGSALGLVVGSGGRSVGGGVVGASEGENVGKGMLSRVSSICRGKDEGEARRNI